MTITTHPGRLNLRHPGDSAHPRTSGIHLSGVLGPFLRKNGWLPPESMGLGELIYSTPIESAGHDSNLVRPAVGIAWEGWIAKQFPAMIHQPGEFQLDGVIGSPDGLEVTPCPIIHEFKVTWKSQSKKIEEQLNWIYQIMGYCRMVEEALGECKGAWLHVLWLMGKYTYRDGDGPKFCSYKFEFAEGELAAMWEAVVIPNIPFAIRETHQ